MDIIQIIVTSSIEISLNQSNIFVIREDNIFDSINKAKLMISKFNPNTVILSFYNFCADNLYIKEFYHLKSIIFSNVRCNDLIIEHSNIQKIEIKGCNVNRIKILNVLNSCIEIYQIENLKEIYTGYCEDTTYISYNSNKDLKFANFECVDNLKTLNLMKNSIENINIPKSVVNFSISKNPIQYTVFPKNIKNLDISYTQISQLNIHELNLTDIDCTGCPHYIFSLLSDQLFVKYFCKHRYRTFDNLTERMKILLRSALQFTDENFRMFLPQLSIIEEENGRLFDDVSEFEDFCSSWMNLNQIFDEDDEIEEPFWKFENDELDDQIDLIDFNQLKDTYEWKKFYLYYNTSIIECINYLKSNPTKIIEEVCIEYLINECTIDDEYLFLNTQLFNKIKEERKNVHNTDFIM